MKTFEYKGRKVELMMMGSEWQRKNGIDIWVEDASGSIPYRGKTHTQPEAEKRAKEIIDAEVEK